MADFVVNNKEIGARIRALRLKQNKTQAYFADILYITASYLALIEAGKRIPNLDVLVRIAKETDVSLDYLIFGDDKDLNTEQKTFDRLCVNYSQDEIHQALCLAEYYLKLSSLKEHNEKIPS